MQCSSEEIERKRQIALEKLRQKGLLKNTATYINQPITSTSPLKKFNFKSKSRSDFASSPTKPYEKPKETTSLAQREISGQCVLISDLRFRVEFAGFSTPLNEIFKSIKSRNYNSQLRRWDFALKDYNELMSKIQTVGAAAKIEPLPPYLVNYFVKSGKQEDDSDIDLSCIDSELLTTLMPHQLEGVRFAVARNGRCLIGDDMGLGKTFQAMAVAHYYYADWPLLIVTTSSMKNEWYSTIIKYLPSIPLMQVQYISSAKDYIGDSTVLIVSYDMMSKALDKLLEKKFGVVIIDESHTLKNFKTKCTKSATQLTKLAKRCVLLSGTPAMSRPAELYTQLSIIDEKFFNNFIDYSKRYCNGHQTHFGWDSTGKSNLNELEVVLNAKFMIRRTKENILKSLPDKVQEVVMLNVKVDDKTNLNELAARYELSQNAKGSEKHSILLTFFSETAKIKIPAVCAYIEEMLETNQKCLVFAHHQVMLNAICQLLLRKNVDFIKIDGSTTSEQRKFNVDKFQSREDCVIAVLSITAANAGITLTSAQVVIFAELHWNPSILSQAESRAHRIGQLNPVVVKYLIAPHTADDSIWPLLKEKEKILSEVGLSKGSIGDATITSHKVTINNDKENESSSKERKTIANTLDITTYFTPSPAKKQDSKTSSFNEEEEDLFDDGLDDVLASMEF